MGKGGLLQEKIIIINRNGTKGARMLQSAEKGLNAGVADTPENRERHVPVIYRTEEELGGDTETPQSHTDVVQLERAAETEEEWTRKTRVTQLKTEGGGEMDSSWL